MTTIYKITNKINGKVYIGKTKLTVNTRFDRHKKLAYDKVNRYFYDAINKHGKENFVISTICRCEDELSDNNEIKWIYYYQANNKKFGYNMMLGGGGGATITGRSMKGKGCYDLWLKKYGKDIADKKWEEKYKKSGKSISNFWKVNTRTISDSTKEKLSIYMKEAYRTGKIKNNLPKLPFGENHPRYGKSHSEKKQKKNIRISQR